MRRQSFPAQSQQSHDYAENKAAFIVMPTNAVLYERATQAESST
jgi:hypothetical protein